MKQEVRSSGGEVLAGLVERVTFHNADNGFSVLRIKGLDYLRSGVFSAKTGD
jgi:hypothetical protein